MGHEEDDKKVTVDTSLKVALQSIGVQETREEVSKEEYEELSSKVSQGVRLRMEQKAREQNRVLMWKSRVNLVKHARALMQNKQFPEAAVAYEKYLRVLEIVYELKSGGLTPELFNKSNRSKELTVITSVYWDLLRIYDTSPAYNERMIRASNKLAEFLPFSKIYPQVTKALLVFQRSCKNPRVIKNLNKQLKIKRGPCFIASSVYEDELHPDVYTLRLFRDKFLKKHEWGRKFIYFYYLWSPSFSKYISNRTLIKKLILPCFRLLVQLLRKNYD
ncbi:MAG: hypothetical protein KDD58_02790 [Bdellovibrionales bacterium]|nr:hypothetical protein [Bdellovibrionales bacterium]